MGRANTSRLILRRFQPSERQLGWNPTGDPELRRSIEHAVLDTFDDADEWISQVHRPAQPLAWFWCVTRHDTTPVAAVVLEPVTYSAGPSSNEVQIEIDRTHPNRTHPTRTGASDRSALS